METFNQKGFEMIS